MIVTFLKPFLLDVSGLCYLSRPLRTQKVCSALRWPWESCLSRYNSAGELAFALATGEGELTLMV